MKQDQDTDKTWWKRVRMYRLMRRVFPQTGEFIEDLRAAHDAEVKRFLEGRCSEDEAAALLAKIKGEA